MAKCRNRVYDHECHLHYAKKYNGYCLDCANAGVPDLLERIEDWRAWVATVIGFDHVTTAKTDPIMREDVDRELRRLSDRIGEVEAERDEARAKDDRADDAAPIVSIFGHRFFKKAPAFACLEGNKTPNAEHVRACLCELARYVLTRLDRVEATVAGT